MKHLLTTVLFLSLRCAQSQYGCYLEGNQYFNAVPISISYDCCSENQRLYDANSEALRHELEECADEIFDDIESNIFDFCNSDLSSCTIDYRDYSCDDEFIRNCKAAGGGYSEADVKMTCQDQYGEMEIFYNDKVDCFASTCTAEEIMEVYRVASARADCTVERASNIKYNGKVVSSGFAGEDSDDSTGVIVGVIIVVLVLIGAIVGIVLCCTRARCCNGTPAQEQPMKQGIPAESPIRDEAQAMEMAQPVVKQVTIYPDGTQTVSYSAYGTAAKAY